MNNEMYPVSGETINIEYKVTDNVKISIVHHSAPKFNPSKNRKIQYQENGASFEYEVFNVVDEYSPSLDQKALPWDFSNPPGDLKYIGVSMIVTMMRRGGVGLAANQCGLRYSIFVIGSGQYAEVIVNPEIVEKSGEEIDNEGCLSFPGVFLKIKRATSVKLKYFDMNGVAQEKTFTGISARVIQHEYDHLQGIKYTSLVNKLNVEAAKQKARGFMRKIKKQGEIVAKNQRLNAAKNKQSQAITLPNPVINQENTLDSGKQLLRFDTPDLIISD